MSENEEGSGSDGNDEEAERSPESLEATLDEVAAEIESAETAAEYDSIAAELDQVAEDIESTDFPESAEDEDDGPKAELETRLEDLSAQLEEARGPYVEDVTTVLSDAIDDVTAGEWTESGVMELTAAIRPFVTTLNDVASTDLHVTEPDIAFEEPSVMGVQLDGLRKVLEDATDVIEDAGLDPDDDAEQISTLLEAADTLADAIDSAESWDDLTVREQLDAYGYYDVLDHRKDFPPEWAALKAWERKGRADMVLLALDKQESDFMERHCFEALRRLAPAEAVDDMIELAQKRNKDAIEVLGKIGDDRPVEGLLNYVDGGDIQLRTTTLKALGEIGSAEATQGVANQLVADEPIVRSQAARALGLIGDTRAIEPLSTVLADDDEQEVRAAAAWALNQIGTQRALDVVDEYRDDRSYLVQIEAEKAGP